MTAKHRKHSWSKYRCTVSVKYTPDVQNSVWREKKKIVTQALVRMWKNWGVLCTAGGM